MDPSLSHITSDKDVVSVTGQCYRSNHHTIYNMVSLTDWSVMRLPAGWTSRNKIGPTADCRVMWHSRRAKERAILSTNSHIYITVQIHIEQTGCESPGARICFIFYDIYFRTLVGYMVLDSRTLSTKGLWMSQHWRDKMRAPNCVIRYKVKCTGYTPFCFQTWIFSSSYNLVYIW